METTNSTLPEPYEEDLWLDVVYPWAVVGITILMALISGWRSYVIIIKDKQKWPKIIRLIHFLLTLGLLSTFPAVFLLTLFSVSVANYLVQIQTHQYSKTIPEQQAIHSIVLGSLPGYIYSCTYLGLAFFWVFRFYSNNSTAKNRAKWIFYAIIIVVFFVWVAMWVLLVLFEKNSSVFKLLHLVELNGVLTYAIFGTRVWCAMRKKTTANIRQQSIQRRIGILTVVCSVIFLFRGIMLGLIMWVDFTRMQYTIVQGVFEWCTIFVFPLSVLVLVGKEMPRTVGAKNYLKTVGRHGKGSRYYATPAATQFSADPENEVEYSAIPIHSTLSMDYSSVSEEDTYSRSDF